MKLTKQVGFCYSANRRAENPLQFYVCGLHGQMQQRLESIGDYKNWDVSYFRIVIDPCLSNNYKISIRSIFFLIRQFQKKV